MTSECVLCVLCECKMSFYRHKDQFNRLSYSFLSLIKKRILLFQFPIIKQDLIALVQQLKHLVSPLLFPKTDLLPFSSSLRQHGGSRGFLRKVVL